MRKHLVVTVVALLALVAAAIVITASLPTSVLPVDVVRMNDLRQRLASSWDEPAGFEAAGDPRFTAFDLAGEPRFSNGEPFPDETAAARQGAHALPVRVAGEVVGVLYVASDLPGQLAQRNSAVRVVALLALAIAAGAVLAQFWWFEVRVRRPFDRLGAFAREMAAGDLDAPLRMDRGNVFGAFTEAFDLMRVELRQARAARAAAKREKQELVDQLGHDIRTPVATIDATTELLALHERDAGRLAKLGLILAKTRQIAALADDLSAANRDAITALEVRSGEYGSDALAALVREADASGRIPHFELPECMVSYDPSRMRQVLDNVLVNAEKYAGTRVEVTGVVEGELLEVWLRDAGPGLPDEELGVVIGRGVRGSNSMGVPGEGLGLFTAATLLERMGGSLTLRSAPGGGLEVAIGVPLAGRDEPARIS